MKKELLKSKGIKQSALAELMGVSEPTVSHWLSDRIRMPAERVADAERITGIDRSIWRPDLYPAVSAEVTSP
jgi:DNA-binding transcriptional regulator YdaS (Cro superfamily)